MLKLLHGICLIMIELLSTRSMSLVEITRQRTLNGRNNIQNYRTANTSPNGYSLGSQALSLCVHTSEQERRWKDKRHFWKTVVATIRRCAINHFSCLLFVSLILYHSIDHFSYSLTLSHFFIFWVNLLLCLCFYLSIFPIFLRKIPIIAFRIWDPDINRQQTNTNTLTHTCI